MSNSPINAISDLYTSFQHKHETVRKRFNRPLTLTEKILGAHLAPIDQPWERGVHYMTLNPDRVAMQDATAQMALLQFMNAGCDEAAVPSTVHCDHLIRAESGAKKDLLSAIDDNHEVYEFLRTASERYGIGFWKPGAGIIHQVVLENYAFPGGLMIGTDSHTPNAGGLGMLAVGVGGADAVDVMVGLPWEVKAPKIIGVNLTGELNGWASAKDVILKLCGILTVSGGTDNIVEYFGSGVSSISCTGKGTITNMGAELGATTSVFPYDERMEHYLKATQRKDIAALATKHKTELCADPEVSKNPERFYDQVIHIDLSTLQPHLVGPHTPDLARSLDEMKDAIKKENYPDTLSSCLIGSCTNSSYEDIGRAAHIARQAKEHGLKAAAPFFITPGSDQIYETIKRDGLLEDLNSVGGNVLANACGPCIGQWKRDNKEENTILTSYNRNFPARNDGNRSTMAFIGSPEIVTAMAFAGKLSFNPLTDSIRTDQGTEVTFTAPQADELPENSFVFDNSGLIAADKNTQTQSIIIDPHSERLQQLTPFTPWNGHDMERLPLLFKAKGKCTTDAISPAGKWLRYRGHLDNISNNMLSGGINAFSGKTGTTKNLLSKKTDIPVSDVARDYQANHLGWVIVGDKNYGEGSSREHAAMSPRLLGAKAVLVKSFARIHETNLKRQGILPLTFCNQDDYDLIQEDDLICITELKELTPKAMLTITLHHNDESKHVFKAAHTLSEEQINWFKAGSALNTIQQ